jgi:hypothetical protein
MWEIRWPPPPAGSHLRYSVRSNSVPKPARDWMLSHTPDSDEGTGHSDLVAATVPI